MIAAMLGEIIPNERINMVVDRPCHTRARSKRAGTLSMDFVVWPQGKATVPRQLNEPRSNAAAKMRGTKAIAFRANIAANVKSGWDFVSFPRRLKAAPYATIEPTM